MTVVVAAIAVGWLVTGPLRRSAETVYSPDRDAYVSTAHPDSNYGGTPTLRLDATPRIRSYLRFRLDGLPGRAVHAELRLWSRTGDLVGYRVHAVADTSWVEGRVTSKDGPAVGEVVARSGPLGPESWSSVDVTRLIRGNSEVSLALSTRSPHNITFDSREGHNRPRLAVQTDPAPALSTAHPAGAEQ